MNTPTWPLLRWQPALLSFVRCTSIGSFTIRHNPAGLLTWKSALWQHKAGGFVWRSSGYAAAGQQSKGVTRVRASGMLIPTAGLLLLRQALMDVTVSISRAHTAAAPARRARARGRLHAGCADLLLHVPSVCPCMIPVYVFASQSRAPQGRLQSPKIKSGLYTEFRI